MYSSNSNGSSSGASGGYSSSAQSGGFSGGMQSDTGHQVTGSSHVHSSHYSPRFHHHHSGYSSNVSFQTGPSDPCRGCCTIL